MLVQNRVAIAKPRLPEEVRQLGVTTRKNTPDILMVVHMLSPDNSYDQLYISNYASIQIRDSCCASRASATCSSSARANTRCGCGSIRSGSPPSADRDDIVRPCGSRTSRSRAVRSGSRLPDGCRFQLTVQTQGRFEE